MLQHGRKTHVHTWVQTHAAWSHTPHIQHVHRHTVFSQITDTCEPTHLHSSYSKIHVYSK